MTIIPKTDHSESFVSFTADLHYAKIIENIFNFIKRKRERERIEGEREGERERNKNPLKNNNLLAQARLEVDMH